MLIVYNEIILYTFFDKIIGYEMPIYFITEDKPVHFIEISLVLPVENYVCINSFIKYLLRKRYILHV